MDHQNWYVAYTYPKAEKKVNTKIQQFGFESFLPLHKVRRVWSDRVKLVEVPLFPSYIFVKTTVENISVLLSKVYGIARFVSFQSEYAKVREKDINIIKNLVTQGRNLKVQTNDFQRGQKVQISSGPFDGVIGEIYSKGGKSNFIIRIESIGQGISMEIPPQWIKAIN